MEPDLYKKYQQRIPIRWFLNTLNTHYRHTFGSRETCAYNMVLFVTWTSRYKHICQWPWGIWACNEGNSKMCFQSSWIRMPCCWKKSPWKIVLFADWSVNTCNGIILTLSCYLASNTHAQADTSTRVSHPCDLICQLNIFCDVIIRYRHKIALFCKLITWFANAINRCINSAGK